jgi:fibronectin type 3 domain-containing protein
MNAHAAREGSRSLCARPARAGAVPVATFPAASFRPAGGLASAVAVAAPAASRARRRAGLAVEPLEGRQLMCAVHELPTWVTPVNDAVGPRLLGGKVAAGQVLGGDMLPLIPASLTSPGKSTSLAADPLPGLPALNSFPSAPAAIYLDFNGSASMKAYSEDADFTTFSASEQSNITLAWRQMATYFAPFNVNVTTVKPSVPTAWGLITNSVTGAGYSYVGVFPNSLTGNPQSFNPAGDARTRQSGIAHEIGHNFGLSHQSDYDALGNKTNEYSSGYDATHGPIMGVDYAQNVHKWFVGHSSNSPSTLQDDVAVISSKIAARPNGGDGFRPDDVGGTLANATVLPTVGAVRTATGIIERMADADAWSFTSAAGGRMAVDVNPVHPSGLIPKVEVYDAAGNLIATKDDADQRGSNNNDVSVSFDAPTAGTYYAIVKSHGDYGDIGQYDVTATDLPAGWGSQYVGGPTAVGGPTGNAGFAKYDAATGTFTIAGAGGSQWAGSDQAQLAGTTLTGDGSVTVRVASIQNTNAFAKAGIMVRESAAQNAKLVALDITPSSGIQFIRRATAGAALTSTTTTAAAFAPTYLRLTRTGSTFTAARSTDGVTFTTIASDTVAMNAAVTVGLFAYSFNANATSTSTFTNLTTTGGVNAAPVLNALGAPAALAAAPGTGTGVNLTWADGAGESGYAVERSTDGTDFTRIATTAADATSYSDNGLWGSMRYSYRVRAVDGSGQSAPSAAVAVVNRPNAPGSFSTSSWKANSIILNWRDVSGETGYRVERSTDGGTTFSTLATVGVNIPSYTDATVVQGNQYKYRIVALSAVGDSPVTPVVTESPRLAATTGLAFTSVAGTEMSFKWNAVAGATGYKIYRSTDGSTFSTLTTVSVDR